MDFSSVTGQDNIKESLISSIENGQVGHAYIFCGPKGIGKRTLARIFASALLCREYSDGKSCDCCPPCRMFASGSNPDYKEVRSEGTSIGIDEIRDIQADIVIKPMYSSKKVYLINDADKMTLQAQNCLLKTLEEPPGYAVIILTTSNYDSLISTVRSRAVRYNFQKNTYEEVHGVLESRLGSSIKGLDFIASYADGVIGTALQLAESDEFMSLRDRTVKIVFHIHRCKMKEVFEVYDFFKENKENINTILDIMTLVYRDLLVIKKAGEENMLINFDKKDIILNNVAEFSTQKLINNIEAIELTRSNIRHNANYQLSIEIMLMKLQEECC